MDSHAPGPEAWQRTSDVVLRGLNHTLSNRLTVLASLVSDVATSTPEGEALGVCQELARELVPLS